MIDFDDYVGVEVTKVDGDEAFGKAYLKEESFNSIGAVHGGLIMTLADTVSGNLVYHYSNRIATTSQANINYLNACMGGDFLYAKAKIIKDGKSLCNVDTEVTDENGKLIAKVNFVFFHLNKEINIR